jgi:hypothetical protein
MAEVTMLLLPGEATAALTPGLVTGMAAALLYLWWRWR